MITAILIVPIEMGSRKKHVGVLGSTVPVFVDRFHHSFFCTSQRYGYLVGGFKEFLFFHIWDNLPTDEVHHFSEG